MREQRELKMQNAKRKKMLQETETSNKKAIKTEPKETARKAPVNSSKQTIKKKREILEVINLTSIGSIF
jgi:hypothetical protein